MQHPYRLEQVRSSATQNWGVLAESQHERNIQASNRCTLVILSTLSSYPSWYNLLSLMHSIEQPVLGIFLLEYCQLSVAHGVMHSLSTGLK